MPTRSQALKTAQFGIIGLGVMGENLALNYQRADRTSAEFVHTDWLSLLPKTPKRRGAKP